MKKILFFICAFVLGLFSLFNFNINNKSYLASASAYDNTYNYVGTVESDYSSMGNYGITDVDTVYFDSSLCFKVSIVNNTAYHFALFHLRSATTYSDSWYLNDWVYFNGYADMNICVIGSQSVYVNRTGQGANITLKAGKSCTIYFSSRIFSGVSNGIPTFGDYHLSSHTYVRSANSFIDMDPDTNFAFDYYDLDSPYPSQNFFYLARLTFGLSLTDSTDYLSPDSNLNTYYDIYSSTGTYSGFDFNGFDLNGIVSKVDSSTIANNNNGFYFYLVPTKFNIRVYRPVQRVNNTLIIYTFDYPQMLVGINAVDYSLRKGNDLYTISYSGTIPNNYYNFIFNNDIQNTLFDEYIEVNFYFNHVLVEPEYDATDNTYYFYSGFDFNFTYYAKPLVSSNGVYDYTFNKPGYVAMEFSLYPFYLPILEMVENAFIFLIFYCPIVSDILELLHLSEFLGSLLTVVNYYTTGVLGTFLTSLISFFIFYALFKSLMPAVSSGAVSVYNDSQFAYNKKRNKEDKRKELEQRKEIKYTQKMIKVEERKRKKK